MNLFIIEYAFRDLFKQKTRTFLGIFGVGVSILLLTSVSFLTDSLSASFVDYITTDAGNQDIVINANPACPGYYKGNFEYQQVIDNIMANVSEVHAVLPRVHYSGWTIGDIENESEEKPWAQIVGLDFEKEYAAGYGKFLNYDEENFNPANRLPENSCIIAYDFAFYNNITVGSTIRFYADFGHEVELKVISLYNHQMKFRSSEDNMILTDINWIGLYFNSLNETESIKVDRNYNFDGKANELVVILKDANTLYDVRDVQGSEIKVMKIGEKIQLTIGIENFSLHFAKLEYLFIAQYITMIFQVVFVFIGIIAMLISGILIHGILTTSVEERIREYGINRVLGAKKRYNLNLILIQATILSTLGTTLGIVGAFVVVSKGILPFINELIPEGFLTNELQFAAQPTSVILSYAIGIGISLLVSIAPAIKVMRMRIIESINPYRHEESIYEIKRDSTTNYKLIIFGLLLAFNGGLFYFLIPQLLLSLEFGLIASVLIGILLVFLIGVTFMGIGLMPLILKAVLAMFAPFMKKLINIVKITIYRYQRRNLSTVVMFSLSFSFIMFTTSMVEIIQNQTAAMIRFQNGSDLQFISQSNSLNAPTEEIEELLMRIEGVERICSYISSAQGLSGIYGSGRYSKDFMVELSDFINLVNEEVTIYAPDENYPHVIYSEYISMNGGTPDAVMDKLFSNPEEHYCIISEALAVALNLRTGDNIRLTFHRGEETEIAIFTIIGYSAHMPGMPRFKGNKFQASGGGVMISQELYIRYMNIPRPAWIDRVLIKLDEGADSSLVEDQITEALGEEFAFRIANTQRSIESDTEMFFAVKISLQLVLIGTVIICLFSLISASYSSILERRREIGIIRTLGLKPREVDQMFRNEALITLISSGTTGSIIGFLTAALLTENMVVLLETPRMWAIPWDVVASIFTISIITLLIGMRMLLRKIRKENIIKIFRATT